jgi:hypothetical protein
MANSRSVIIEVEEAPALGKTNPRAGSIIVSFSHINLQGDPEIDMAEDCNRQPKLKPRSTPGILMANVCDVMGQTRAGLCRPALLIAR